VVEARGEGAEVEFGDGGSGDGFILGAGGGLPGGLERDAAEGDDVADSEAFGRVGGLFDIGAEFGAVGSGHGGEIGAVEGDGTGRERAEAEDGGDQGRLAGAVGADDTGDGTGRGSEARRSEDGAAPCPHLGIANDEAAHVIRR
jgi:hypothetical protein